MWECGPAPKGAAFTPDGNQIWVSLLAGPPAVQVFDATTLELLGEVALGEDGAVEIVFSLDGEHAYASQMETARVYEIDTTTRAVTRTFDTESSWSKMVELHDVYCKPLEDGSLAVGLVNGCNKPSVEAVSWKELGIKGRKPVRDLWAQKDLGKFSGEFSMGVPAHGAQLLKIG